MRKSCCAALLATLAYALPSQGQVVNVVTDGQAADLQCPARKKSKPAPSRPARTQTQAAPEEEGVLEPPSPDELEGILPADSPANGQPIRLAPHPAGRPAAIGIWGDSHLAAHFFQDELLRLAGLKRGQVQPTFIPASLGRPGVRLPVRKHCQGDGWTYKLAYAAQPGQGAVFGPALAQLRSQTAGAYLWVDFRFQPGEPSLKGLDILFTPERGATTRVALTVDDGEEQIVSLDHEGDGRLQIQSDRPFSVVRLRLEEGNLTLEGFKPGYVEAPAARMDTMAIPGATVRGWANARPDYIRNRLGDTDYDFVVLEYGTNEGNQRNFNEQAYTDDLRAALGNLRRAFPAAQCLLIGPTDRGVLVRHRKAKTGKSGKKQSSLPAPKPKAELLHYARIHRQISDIQRDVGREFNCGAWSWQEAMGGMGGAYRWLYHSPRLMAKDLIHLTIPGYQQSAREFAEVVRFADWLANGNAAQ